MRTLDRKLARNLWHLKGQALAIAVVMACGIATYIMSVGTLHSLRETRDLYYDRYRFGDIFVSLKRAPLSVAERIAALPGVAAVDARVVFAATLDMPDLNEPAMGRIISLPDNAAPSLNALYLRHGRFLEPREVDAVLVTESFALAHELKLGDRIAMIINGHKRRMKMVGVALSPEYVFAIGPGSLMPDPKRYGVFWMSRHALEAAVNMDGAFNDLSLRTSQDADPAAIVAAVDRLLAPYGGLAAITRKDQVSNWFLSSELNQLRAMAIASPLVFLSVAAFLTHIVLMRLIATEREEIGTLKALGYGTRDIAVHYLKLVGVIALIAVVLGSAAGYWLGRSLTELYTEYYRFPVLSYHIVPAVFLQGALFCFVAAYSGTLMTVLKAAALPPAVAMRPAPPPVFRPTLVERLKLEHWFSQPARIILRQIERRPVRFVFSVAGVGMALAIFIGSAFMEDALNYILEVQYDVTERQDALITFVETRDRRAVFEIMSLPGVTKAEPGRAVAVRLSAGPRQYRTSITGIPPQADLRRVIDDRLRAVEPPPDGLLLGRKLADILEVTPGDVVYVEVLEDQRPRRLLPVAGIVEGFIGAQAYMSMSGLHRLMMEGDTVSSLAVSLDDQTAGNFFVRLKNSPLVASVTRGDTMRRTFDETMGENVRTMTLFNVAFAGLIAFGVVYNTVRIAFSERARELASLRVIGMTRGEVGYILLGEVAVVVLLALPLGCLMGYGLVLCWKPLLDTELYRIPIVIASSTYGVAILVVLAAAFVSSWAIWRRIRHLDLVRVLKTRD